MSWENIAPCRSTHSTVQVTANGRTLETCQDKILLGQRQLAISLNARGREYYVDIVIRFRSASGERISYQAWCRTWTPAAIRNALRTPPDERTPQLYDLDIDVGSVIYDERPRRQGRILEVGFELISGEAALMRATPHRLYEAYEVVQKHPKACPELKQIITAPAPNILDDFDGSDKIFFRLPASHGANRRSHA